MSSWPRLRVALGALWLLCKVGLALASLPAAVVLALWMVMR